LSGILVSFSCGFQDPTGLRIEVTAFLRAAGGTSEFGFNNGILPPRRESGKGAVC